MNRLVWMTKDDQPRNLWLFTKYSTRLGRRIPLLGEYERFQCHRCRKIDEIAALRTGVSPQVRVRAKTDVIGTSEDWTVVSERFRSLVEKHNIAGLEFAQIPASPGFFAVIPTILVPIDEAGCVKLGGSFLGKCEQCGRYGYTTGWPTRSYMQVPDGELVFFTRRVCEGTLGRKCCLYTTETVQRLLEENAITGIDCYLSLEDPA